MEPEESDRSERYRQDFAHMPGVNSNDVSPAFRELSPADTTRRGMVWSSIGVGLLVVAVGVYFISDWLHWF